MGLISKDTLLSMADDAYMSDVQLDFFKDILEKQKDKTLSSIKHSEQNLIATDNNADVTDVATNIEIQQIELKRMERERKLLNKINKTIRLINDKEYGYCQSTGEQIGLKRLLARPTATLSVAAKERQEFRKKTSGVVRKY